MDTKNILFYEWSDVNRQPLNFNHIEDFVNFCKQSNIKISRKNHNFLNTHKNVYAVCKNAKNEMIMSGDYRNLRKNRSKHRNNA